MAVSSTSSQALWQPSQPKKRVVELRSDRLWNNTSHVPEALKSPVTTPSQLWRRPKPVLPAKPESLRTPSLWYSTSVVAATAAPAPAPASVPAPATASTTKTHDPSKRLSRSVSSVTRTASPAAVPRRRSWIESVLPKYVGRSSHYRNSHSIWAEQMFEQRKQYEANVNWADFVLPSYVQSGPYRTSHSIWAEQMFAQRRHVMEPSWVDSALPSYVKSGPYRTSHSVWAEQMFEQRQQVVLEGSWVENALPYYVKSGAYDTTHSIWLKTARANGATISWTEGVFPAYVQNGAYRTSHSVWLEQAASNGANISWIDDVLPHYVQRSQQYRTTHDIWVEQAPTRRSSTDHYGRSHSMPPSSPIPSGACSPVSSVHDSYHSRKPSSFLQHRTTPSESHSRSGSVPRTVAFYPPGTLSRTASSLTAHEEPVPVASMLSPPTSTKQDAIMGMKTPASARFAALQSPCFFHKRFDDAVNLDRVLEEIQEEEGLSSSRLLQTAISVREISKQLQRKPIKRAVRSIMIVTKARDNGLVYMTRELALWLMGTPRYGSNLGVTVYVDAKLKTSKRFDAAGIVAQNPAFAKMLRYWDPDLCWSKPESFDLVLTLGGDGTVLFTSFSLFQRIVPPVLAFGLGSLGFLTPFKFNEYKNSLDKVMGDEGMRVNLRMRFTCTVFRAPQTIAVKGSKARKALPSPVDTTQMVEGEQFEVLNELVIDRGPSPYVSNLELYADDDLLTVVQADGCIFSTPTGSTAYSLSAGGPLTHPGIPGLILTPICPHTLSFRPMVLSDSLCLKVCIPRDSRSTAYASFDGKHRVELRRGDCVRIEAGRYPFPTVTGPEGTGAEWFNSVRRALRWNTRGAMQKAFGSSTTKKAQQSPPSSAARFDTSIEEEFSDDLARANIPEDDEDEDEAEEETEWDIDFDPIKEEVTGISAGVSVVDSGIGLSDAGSHYSPTKRNMVTGPLPEQGIRGGDIAGLFGNRMQQVRQGLGVSGAWFPAQFA